MQVDRSMSRMVNKLPTGPRPQKARHFLPGHIECKFQFFERLAVVLPLSSVYL